MVSKSVSQNTTIGSQSVLLHMLDLGKLHLLEVISRPKYQEVFEGGGGGGVMEAKQFILNKLSYLQTLFCMWESMSQVWSWKYHFRHMYENKENHCCPQQPVRVQLTFCNNAIQNEGCAVIGCYGQQRFPFRLLHKSPSSSFFSTVLFSTPPPPNSRRKPLQYLTQLCIQETCLL